MRKGRLHKNVRRVRESVNNLDDLFVKFIEIKKAEGRAERTLRQYNENYRYFMEFLDQYKIERNVKNITKDVIRSYITYMREERVKFEDHKFKTEKSKTVGLSPTTINTRLKTLRVLFKTLYEEGLINDNPMTGIKNVNEPEEKIEILTADELNRLFMAPNKRYFADFRDYVLMNLLLDGMMRISEALGLKESDFDFANKTVTIPATIAKNRKARTIPLKQRTIRLIKELITENKADFESDYIFLTNYGEPITSDHFRKRLNHFAEKAGIKKNVRPHLFRHTAATLFLEAGGDLRHLQLLLGHSDLRVILRYTHLSNESLKNQHDKFSAINVVIGKLNQPRKIKR
jgi:integrase/recombinase XerD